MANIYLANPTYDGMIDAKAGRGLWLASREHRVESDETPCSLIPLNCNAHWCNAINGRDGVKYDWLAMLHADVGPEPYWIDTLIGLAEQHGADLMSAVVPVKDMGGWVSTAIWIPGSLFGLGHRLSAAQIYHPSFPDVFGVNEAVDALENLPTEIRQTGLPREALLTNTGCMVVRCDRPWRTRVWFDDLNGIEDVDGKWKPAGKSEDYFFSHRIAQEGGKVMATRQIHLTHRGSLRFHSHVVWGNPRDAAR